jgi:hypothetical protein
MPLIAETLGPRRKQTATERVTGNGDPLLAKKKARQAAKEKSGSSATGSTPATLAAVQMEPEVNILTSIPSQTPGLQELDGSDNEVTDVCAWWHEQRLEYPRLLCMALDYLTIPGVYLTVRFLSFIDPSL